MIGYCCKYTPVELLGALGEDPVLMDAEEKDFEQAESLTHANLCCHAKSVIQQGMETEALVLMDCCDSVRRAFDVLRAEKPQSRVRLMSLPHENGQCARIRLKQELLGLISAYREEKGAAFQKELFLQACRGQEKKRPDGPWVAVLGARIPPSVLEMIQEYLPVPVVNLTCSGNRILEEPPAGAEEMETDGLMDWYAGALLRMTPCMRMNDVAGRRGLTEDPVLKGVVYNTVKFCDYYGFDYAEVKKYTRIPVLKIESDYMPQPSGQLSTRLEAFAETLGYRGGQGQREDRRDGEDSAKITERTEREKKMGKHTIKTGLYAGIDSGSTTTNLVVINEKQEVVASAIVRTGAKAQNGARAALDAVCRDLSIEPEMLNAVVATGYGRNNIPFATGTKTEITCHAKGAFYLNPSVRTIVDIGGQDSKVICLDEKGAVTNFIMNDKCAAGTGRFLEMMARTLEMDMEEMSRRGLKWDHDLTISSMCTVFAESEVISLIADNHSEADIIHGLNKSVAAKTVSMVSRAKGEAPFMMTGGVARNRGVVRELETKLGAPLFIAQDPDLCGALGAALFAADGAD